MKPTDSLIEELLRFLAAKTSTYHGQDCSKRIKSCLTCARYAVGFRKGKVRLHVRLSNASIVVTRSYYKSDLVLFLYRHHQPGLDMCF